MGLGVGMWLFVHLLILSIQLILEASSTMLCTQLGFPHFLALGSSHCICDQPLNPMGIHLFHCVYGGKRMVSHDFVWNALVYNEGCEISQFT